MGFPSPGPVAPFAWQLGHAAGFTAKLPELSSEAFGEPVEKPLPGIESRIDPPGTVDHLDAHRLFECQACVAGQQDLGTSDRVAEGLRDLRRDGRLRSSLSCYRSSYLSSDLGVDGAFARRQELLQLSEERDIPEGLL